MKGVYTSTKLILNELEILYCTKFVSDEEAIYFKLFVFLLHNSLNWANKIS